MTSSGLKKKKKAAKKKKKKLLNKHKDKGGVGINIHSSTTTIQQGEVDLKNQEIDGGNVKNSCNSKLIQEESGSSNIGLVLESKSMEGSGRINGVEKAETEPAIKEEKKEEVVEPVGEDESAGDSVSRTVSIEVAEEIAKEESGNGDSLVDDADKILGSSISTEDAKLIEKPESLNEEELEKSTESLKEEELEKSVVEEVPTVDTVEDIVSPISEVVTDDPVEMVVSVSEESPQVVEDIPIVEEIKKLEANESPQKESENKFVETPVVESVVIEKTEASNVPASNESGDKVVAASVDASSVDTEVAEESGITERAREEPQENVLIVPPMVQKSTWKSCCGLFEAVSSSDR